MEQWLLTHRGALGRQSNPGQALPLWQEAPHCQSWDNPTGLGDSELDLALRLSCQTSEPPELGFLARISYSMP